jgi:hypothetical protein
MILQEMIESRVLHFVISQDFSFIWELCWLHSCKFIANLRKHLLPSLLCLVENIVTLLNTGWFECADESVFCICDIRPCFVIWSRSMCYLMKIKSLISHSFNFLLLGLVMFLKLVLGELHTEQNFNHCLVYEEVIFIRIMQLFGLKGLCKCSYLLIFKCLEYLHSCWLAIIVQNSICFMKRN